MYRVEAKQSLDTPEAVLYMGRDCKEARRVFAEAIPASVSVVLRVWIVKKKPGKPDRGQWEAAELFRRYRTISTGQTLAAVG